MNKAPSISHNSGTDGIVSGLYLKDTTIQNNWQKTIKWDMLTHFGYGPGQGAVFKEMGVDIRIGNQCRSAFRQAVWLLPHPNCITISILG